MRSIMSADAKNNFGELMDLARAAPVAVTTFDRPVVVVALAEFERLKELETAFKAAKRQKKELPRDKARHYRKLSFTWGMADDAPAG